MFWMDVVLFWVMRVLNFAAWGLPTSMPWRTRVMARASLTLNSGWDHRSFERRSMAMPVRIRVIAPVRTKRPNFARRGRRPGAWLGRRQTDLKVK